MVRPGRRKPDQPPREPERPQKDAGDTGAEVEKAVEEGLTRVPPD